MEDNKELIVADEVLPALNKHSNEIEKLKAVIRDLQNDINQAKEQQNSMPLDFRKLDAFFAIQQYYYDIFAKNEISQEYVPFEIILLADKWATKMFKRDLDLQVNKFYKQLIKKEEREKRKVKKEILKAKLKDELLKPFRFIKKIFTRKKKEKETGRTE